MSGYTCLGVDASGSRCGLALVSMETCGPKKLLWQTTVYASKNESPYLATIETFDAIVGTIIDTAPYGAVDLIAIEDPTGFAYATALHRTKRTTNAAAVFGFPWMTAIFMLSFNKVFGMLSTSIVTTPTVYTFQPSQWQARLGANDFYPIGNVKSALQLVMDERYPEKNRKHIVRGLVATLLDAPSIIETRKLRSGRYDWVVEQDGVDAAGIAVIGLQEHTTGNPKAAPKRKIRARPRTRAARGSNGDTPRLPLATTQH